MRFDEDDPFPPDAVGEATDLAWRFARELWLKLVLLSCASVSAEDRDAAADAVAKTWPPLCRAMNALAELAPNAARTGQDQDAAFRDRLEARGLLDRQDRRMIPTWRAALDAMRVVDALAYANEFGIPRGDRVAALASAFRAWPALCREAVDVAELTPRAALRKAA